MAQNPQGMQIYSTPSHTAWITDAAKLQARDELGLGVDQLAGIVARFITRTHPQTSPRYTDCSAAASVAFEMLTGMPPNLCAADHKSWLVDARDIPESTSHAPTVTFVSLTASADSFGAEDGHRFIVLQSKGRFRLLQAFKDKCSLGDFATHPKFAQSWSADEFRKWWEQLLLIEQRGTAANACEMDALLGLPYDGPLGRSVVVKSDVRLFCSSSPPQAPMSLSYRTREERTIVPGAIAPDHTIKLRAISDGVAKLWVERGNTPVSCDEVNELCVIVAGGDASDPTVHAPVVGGCYILEWVKSYEISISGVRVTTITCQRQQSLLAGSGANVK